MVWNIERTRTFSREEEGEYHPLLFPPVTTQVGWALEIDAVASGTLPRRRIGFMLPYTFVESRYVFGPTVEIISGLDGVANGFHLIEFTWDNSYPSLAARIQDYGVAFAPDRGVFPCTARLWSLV